MIETTVVQFVVETLVCTLNAAQIVSISLVYWAEEDTVIDGNYYTYITYITYIYMYNNCHCSLRLSNVKMCEYLQKKPSNSVFTLTKKHFNLIFHKS